MSDFAAAVLHPQIAPALVWVALAVIAVVVYSIRLCVLGIYCDAEQTERGGSALLGAHLRSFFAWTMAPLEWIARKTNISPTGVTLLSVLLSVISGALAAVGWLGLAGSAYLVSGICDFLDGRLARSTGRTTSSGAALDSILDRYSDSAVLVGLAWHYRNSWLLLAILLLLTGGFFVPYVRARGEGLGIAVKVGLMQRPERVVLLGLSLLFAPLINLSLEVSRHELFLGGMIAVMAALTHVTAVWRIVHVVRILERQAPAADE